MHDLSAEEIERARAVLVRAVARVCPERLADRRDDIVQEALMKVLSAAGKGSGLPGASYRWKAAYTATVDELRRPRVRKEEPLERESEIEASRDDPELRRALLREIGKLRPDRRRAVMLQLYGFSLEESATILGWNAKRVENHRYLGMRDLRAALKEQGFER